MHPSSSDSDESPPSRHTRLRKKSGTVSPRLVVHRSARHIHVQLVNATLCSLWLPRRSRRRGRAGDKRPCSVVGQRSPSAKAAAARYVVGSPRRPRRVVRLRRRTTAALADAARENGLSF